MTTNTKQERLEAEGPAVVTADHVQDRVLNAGAGSKVAWRRLPAHEKAFKLGHLVCKDLCKDQKTIAREVEKAALRRDFWEEFTEKWLLCQASIPGGSDFNRVRVAGTPGSFCDVQIDTKRFMRRAEDALGSRDWMILRRVCGEGWSIAAAVTDISPSYRDSTLARFREACDAGIEAFETARRA